jgi:hypothetical protein
MIERYELMIERYEVMIERYEVMIEFLYIQTNEGFKKIKSKAEQWRSHKSQC